VKIATRFTRTPHLLVASCLVFLIGCAEQTATAPDRAKALDSSGQPAFTATIANHITLYNKSGKAQVFNESQDVNVNFKSGVGRATPKPRAKSVVSSTTAPNGVTPDGVVVAPVLALATGAEPDNYDEIMVDSVGNVVHLIATGATGTTTPVTDSYAYTNGVLTNWNHSIWSTASGGYVLSYQAIRGYSTTGALVGEVISAITTTTSPPRTFTSKAPFGAKIAALSTLKRIACALSPTVAYAATVRCLGPTLRFAGETVAVVGTIAAIAAIPEISATFTIAQQTAATATAGGFFLWGAALWTDGLHGMLDCFNKNGGGQKRSTAPERI
jgi:hypothetical protein